MEIDNLALIKSDWLRGPFPNRTTRKKINKKTKQKKWKEEEHSILIAFSKYFFYIEN